MGVQFPELMEDLSLPMFFGEDKFFSSVLRVGSPGVRLWTHYDVSRIAGRSGWDEPYVLCVSMSGVYMYGYCIGANFVCVCVVCVVSLFLSHCLCV